MNNITNLTEHLECPITHAIFRNPVLIDDGIIYEYNAIKKWLKENNNLSPIRKKN